MPSVTGVTGAVEYELVGDPAFVFVHANGFCKEIWHPLIAELGSPGHVAIDQPGHGRSDAPEPPYDWWDFGRNALRVIDHVGIDHPVGVGHSSGATALAMAEILRPGTFSRLVLIEPIVFPPPHGRTTDHPLITAALRRRTTFDSFAAAAAAYRGRGPFARWDDRALEAYVQHGFEDDGEGGWTLRCPPEVEAEVYATSQEHAAWDRLDEIRCPVQLVAGADSDTHTAPVLEAMMERFADADLHVVPGATHFVPMELPVELGAIIR